MTNDEAKKVLSRIDFVFNTESERKIAHELVELKVEGFNIPDDDDEALNAFTKKWNAFCDKYTLWVMVDQIGHKNGLWF